MRGATETRRQSARAQRTKASKTVTCRSHLKAKFSSAVTKTKQDSNAKDAKVTPAKASGFKAEKIVVQRRHVHSPSEAIPTVKKNVGLSMSNIEQRSTWNSPAKMVKSLKSKRDSSAEANNVLDRPKRQLDLMRPRWPPYRKTTRGS